MAKKSKISQSEVHAYVHILKELTEKKGWGKSQIYTQQECLKHSEIKKCLGANKPENVVKIDENNFYVIEAKNERKKIDIALKEAKKDYAEKINQSKLIKAIFVTGIAGNDKEGFIAKSQFFHNNKWQNITENGILITGLLSTNQIRRIMAIKNPAIVDVEITEQEFMKTAENINGILHENSINKDYRAKFISAILLAMSEGKDLDLNEETTVLIATINKRVEILLKRHKKQSFSRFIKIDEPSNPDNHTKVKKAIIRTYQELLGLNIRSAMQSGKDILGKFYEAFLKYGNGAKEIGIVLTPRHITKFSAEALDITHNDIVLDPACGTGGFLVAAYDEVRRKTEKDKDFENFKLYGLYGIEEQDPVISLAIVNMIFRGDGKNNMIEGNCFKKWLDVKTEGGCTFAEFITDDEDFENRISPITKVMMNPPFAKPNTDDKEFRFIEHALKQMQDEGLLFSVLPLSVMFEGGVEKAWRMDSLLAENTLMAVVSFPPELFYPIGVYTLGIVIKKGIPHPKKQSVFWARAVHDGFVKKKGKRLPSPSEPNDLEKLTPLLKKFIRDPTIRIQSKPQFYKKAPIDYKEPLLELVPEAYVDDFPLTEKKSLESVDELIRETAATIVRFGDRDSNPNLTNNIVFSSYLIKDFFDINKGKGKYLKDCEEGITPLISATVSNNGIAGFVDLEPTFKAPAITMERVTGNAFVQLEDFATVPDDLFVLTPKSELPIEVMFYIVSVLNHQKWRLNYSRKLTPDRFKKLEIDLPTKNNKVDINYIKKIVKNSHGWEIVQ